MELIKIAPSESKLWEQVWRLYTESFPDYERRRISSHSRAIEHDDFNTYIALENGNLLALLFFWKHDDLIYIEHIAVHSSSRGRNIGSTILRNFIDSNPGCRIILEIDPPVDEVSIKRQRFYEKAGFIKNDYPYEHPSYSKNGMPHVLVLMSHPLPITPEEKENFVEYMKGTVMKYID